MHDPIDWTLIDRYTAGDASLEERARVEQWLQSPGSSRTVLDAYTQVQNDDRHANRHKTAEAVIARVMSRVHATPPRARTVGGASYRRWPIKLLAATTAVVVLGIVIPSMRVSRNTAPMYESTYATTTAQLAHVTLPDGSKMTLAPETRVRFSGTVKGRRTVTLYGRAYFTVTHNPDAPFTVITPTGSTRVLGTEFDVQQYDDDTVAHVMVTTGKVQIIASPGKIAILTPGMTGTMTDSAVVTMESAPVSKLTGWTHGRLVFQDTPVPVLLQTVARWCNCEFQLTDSTLLARHVTTALTADEPAKMMALLRDLLDVTMSVDGRIVTLRPRSPNVRRPHVQAEKQSIRDIVPFIKEAGK